MARLVGVGLPREKHMEIALTYTYGVERTRTRETLGSTGVSPDTRIKDLTEDELIKLRDFIQANYEVEGGLRREAAADIRRKIEISYYQGHRRRARLPVHDQRTKADARTRKGPKHIVAGKKKTKRRGHQ